ncbi:MAG: GspE/PulE family protein [Candidatus Pacebacteria bacterium]|nr:GspE/PulE family protein [Candidatus Paceibacterota bacterium]
MDDQELKKVYDYLLSCSIDKKQNIDAAYEKAQKTKANIFEILVNDKILKEEEATKIKADFLRIPYVSLKEKVIDEAVLRVIPEKAVMFYKFVPFEYDNNLLKVGMVNPDNFDALDALKFISIRHGISTKIYLISKGSFNTITKQYKTFGDELKNVLETVDKRIEHKEERGDKDKDKETQRITEEAPVSKVVDIIISHAVEGKASDIHIESSEKDLRVRYRLDGELHDSLILPKKLGPAVVSRIKILSNLKIDETRKPQDGRFRFNLSDHSGLGKSVDLRVSTFPTVNGEKVVMRILDTSSEIANLESLGIRLKALNIVKENIKKPFGIILITGPTGSGKSTTLYAILKLLNKEGVNVVTLEDPVEYYLEGINQSQVKPEIGYTFASGLRSILRQDPDIVMVGEIRDKETAELAMHAALTGHLVLSTLHTNNSVGVIPRLVDMGIESFLIGSALNIAIAQRLVRRICPYCKEEIQVPPEILASVEEEIKFIPEEQRNDVDISKGLKFYRGKGCKECKNSGSIGRVGIYEVLSMTPEMEKVIHAKVTDNDIEEETKRQGMITMKQDGIIKALLGMTSIEEVMRVTEE